MTTKERIEASIKRVRKLYPVIALDETKSAKYLVLLTSKQIEIHLSKKVRTMLADQRTSLVAPEGLINKIPVERIKIGETYHIAIVLTVGEFTKKFCNGTFKVLTYKERRPVTEESVVETTTENTVEAQQDQPTVKVEENIDKKVTFLGMVAIFKHRSDEKGSYNDTDTVIITGKKLNPSLLQYLSQKNYILQTAA